MCQYGVWIKNCVNIIWYKLYKYNLKNYFYFYLLGSGLNDGQWHEVRFLAKENFAILTIDGDEASAVRTNSPLQVKTGEKYFFGGKIRIFKNILSNLKFQWRLTRKNWQVNKEILAVDLKKKSMISWVQNEW